MGLKPIPRGIISLQLGSGIGCAGKGKIALHHLCGRNRALIGLCLGITEALVVSEEVSLTSPEVRSDGATGGSAEAAVMVAGLCQIVRRREVVLPVVGADVAVEIVLIDGAMPLFAAAFW